MVRAIGMKFVSSARIRYVRDYLATGVGHLIKPCAMEKWYPHNHVEMSYYIPLFTWM